MGYVHTGYFRRKLFHVDKKDGAGDSVSGYPVTYNILDAFGTFDAIDSDMFGLMAEEDYQTRLTAFYAYVALSEEFEGFDPEASIINDLGPDGYDENSCEPGSPHTIK